GAESVGIEAGINNKSFVTVFQCVLEREELWKLNIKKNITPYEGIILDNQFFLNIFEFSKYNSITIQSIFYISEYNTEIHIEDPEEMERFFRDIKNNLEMKIHKIILSKEGFSVVFNKFGYIEIVSDLESFARYREFLRNLIKIGFEDNGID